jgi:alpha-amylase/alpha-mannosidase (GH57 family)
MTMQDERLPVVLLWHMHQPDYRDALSGQYRLPWTLLHAIKDYTDMAAHLEDNADARAVVNFTPVLIEQLQSLDKALRDYLERDVPLPDPVFAVLTETPLPRSGLVRAQLQAALLRAHETHLIARYPAYAGLAKMARQFDVADTTVYLSDQFLRDLGTWYVLAWLGETIKRRDARVASLLEHSGPFDARARRTLLEIVGDSLADLLPRYRRLIRSGRIELAVSPYSHPILPLLLDFKAAHESQPDAPLPKASNYPGGAERVQWHLQHALQVAEKTFGVRPAGCWPSEGAVSDAALTAIASAGFSWIATGGTVLHGTLAKQQRNAGAVPECQAFACGAQEAKALHAIFRHDGLSDLIGFSYSSWHGDDAVTHFMNELEGVATQACAQSSGKPLLLVALDGENAWEHYPFNGYYFLRGLYAALARHPRFKLCLMSEALESGGTANTLGSVRAGSWVHGTLATWMGDADKNRGWDLLVAAKHAVDAALASGRFDASQRERILTQLAHCESSDWFWWFGDYNPSEAVRDFDELFRHQLASLYTLIGQEVPANLRMFISTGRGAPEGGGVMRRAQA